ncbi:MAG TPA: DUF881 domain-containing protein [Nocardioides sp.]|uniref:DUF881 domain-containing protein n=1 Tax=Nocardioides sp. TaxID=35761 RepID=UPI002B96CC64|nr:DUF881 domain-containing protein [Nocardioides sp.]HTW17673.1 DUF881 domain-containing protein [Nocardioides sp.]
MTTEHPHAGPSRWRRLLRPWAIGTPAVVLVCGGLFVVSYQNSEGIDLRPGRYTDLADLVRTESDRYERLEDRVADLNDEVTALSESVNDRTVNRYRRQIERVEDPAGMVEREGEGVTVTLTDSPPELLEAATESGVRLSDFVVHQQDIQAVVNALWRGGAEAVTVQGKRIVSTTGIKCIGNSVTLQGQPYSPPYVISAVGDQGDLLTALSDDENLQTYRQQAEDPDIAIGWELEIEDDLTAPAYDGLLDLSYAVPME